MPSPDRSYLAIGDVLQGVHWDSYTFTSNATSDVWQFYIGGQLHVTITINYSDGTKTLETGGTKVFA